MMISDVERRRRVMLVVEDLISHGTNVNTTWMHETLDAFLEDYFLFMNDTREGHTIYRTVVQSAIVAYARNVATTSEFVELLQYIIKSYNFIGKAPASKCIYKLYT